MRNTVRKTTKQTILLLSAIFLIIIQVSCDSDTGAKLEGFKGFVRAMDISNDSLYVAVASDSGDVRKQQRVRGVIRVFDIQTEEMLSLLEGHTNMVLCVDFSPDGRYVASGSFNSFDQGVVKVWDIQKEEEIVSIERIDGKVSSVKFIDNNQIAVANYGKTTFDHRGEIKTASESKILFYDAFTGDLTDTISAYDGPTWSMELSENGRALITRGHDGKQNIIKFWNIAGKNLVRQVDTGEYYGSTFDVSEDLRFVVYGILHKMGTVIIKDTVSGKELKRIDAHERFVYFTMFAPDYSYIITAGNPGIPQQPVAEIYVWDIETEELVKKFLKERKHFYPTAVEIAPNGKYLLSADWKIYYWDLEKELYNQDKE